MDRKVLHQTNKTDNLKSAIYDLGDIVFYAEIGELHLKSSGEQIHIERKVSQVLQCLAISPNQVVTRQTIFDTVWPNMTVSDDSLNRCIAMLRKIFRQHDLNVVIKTHPKVGFHLTIDEIDAPEKNIRSNGLGNQIQTEPSIDGQECMNRPHAPSATKRVKVWPSKLATISFAVVFCLITILSFWLTQPLQVSSSLTAQRIIILPFATKNEGLSNYQPLANAIRRKVANHPYHTTVAESELDNTIHLSNREIGARYSAKFIVSGEIKHSQTRDILQWQLVDAQTGDILLSKQLNLKLQSLMTSSQIVMTDIIATLGNTLYANNTEEHVNYIVESASALFNPAESWQQHRPIITLVAKAVVDIDSESVVALKALARFLTQTMWPLGYQNLPYSNLAIRVLEKAAVISPTDIELYQLLMRIHALQYNWSAASETVALAQSSIANLDHRFDDMQAEMKMISGQASPSLITYFQHAHQNEPLDRYYLLSLTQLYLLSGQHKAAYLAQTNIIQATYNWQFHGIALGQLCIEFGDLNGGKQLVWSGYEYLGVPIQYQSDIEKLYQQKTPDYLALSRLEKATENGEILASTLLFMYGSLGLVDKYYDVALSLIDNYQFNFLSLINLHSEKLIQHPRFPALVKKLGLLEFWQATAFPSYCQNNGKNICLTPT
ncbi:hypothetical protein HII17_09780 [Thalassotalea sp. M1531]|uniref:OmpR/PhoB-type domain-containing protein n=1 Tax=Thalassotalea algicola TaxID=2716224 RepID=A0A7Y0LC60_9GAMM|nr:winged helix-turn-helix domain-containing protein [Thalassotalea algicola]NMP31854.1 hypothetical protein [Thalassotalea algicola]